MVFSPWHYLPAAFSAFLVMVLALRVRSHRSLALIMALSGLLGLAGYLSAGNFRFYPLDFHVMHTWTGLTALLLSLGLFLDGIWARKVQGRAHCRLGYVALAFAALALVSGLLLLSGWVSEEEQGAAIQGSAQPEQQIQQTSSSHLPEVEAVEFQGVRLTPLGQQGNNAIRGTQYLDKATFRLHVTGLVKEDLNLSYEELLAFPAYSELAYMPCVDGWGFSAKWTGFRVTDLLNRSGLLPGASYVVFYSADGYSTGLPLDFLQRNETLMAYGINDVTLPPERGFPLQLVAKNRYGYKWAKWITKIEVTDTEVKGYWESMGYSNSAKVGEFPFG
ncbi:Sulfoxide reductase catalytic subunit YedY [uncultured archaeon]|nr:Sulfoxide reductase catalytic subunit YedY [uncultured archaeon]